MNSLFRLTDPNGQDMHQSYPLRKLYQDEQAAKNGVPLPSDVSAFANNPVQQYSGSGSIASHAATVKPTRGGKRGPGLARSAAPTKRGRK